MQQQSQKLPAMSEKVLKLRKCIKTVPELVLNVHIRSYIRIEVTWQCKWSHSGGAGWPTTAARSAIEKFGAAKR
jgi:hypothetical protein